MSLLEQYAKDREKDLSVLKTVALLKLKEEKLDREALEWYLDKAFKIGHYVGHCRGENHVRQVYDLDGVNNER